MNTARNYFAIPPGQAVFEEMVLSDISEAEMALRLGMEESAFQKLLSGEQELDQKLSEKLAEVLGKTSAYWMYKEEEYRRRLALKDGLKSFADEDYNIQLDW